MAQRLIHRFFIPIFFRTVLAAGLLAAGLLAACAPQPTPASDSTTLTVMAAASLTASFRELGTAFEAQQPDVNVEFNFAGSQQLAQQIAQGAPADVFASANQAQMDAVIKSGQIDPAAPRIFARNRLVVIYPKENPAKIASLQDLARPGLRIDLAAREVPVGQYALDFFAKASADPAFSPTYQADVIKNVVSYEENVKAVVTKVTLGEADAGIVYATDAQPAPDQPSDLGQLAIPDALNVVAAYPIAIIKDSPTPTTAQAFVDFVRAPAGQAILKKYGFTAEE